MVKEQIVSPSSPDDREKIAQVIDSIRFEEKFEFEYDGIKYQILLCNTNEEKGSPVAYFESTGISGFDIYIWDSLPEDWKRVAMMHEIKEIHLRIKMKWGKVNAHWEARKFEDKYGLAKLGTVEFGKYKKYRTQYERTN